MTTPEDAEVEAELAEEAVIVDDHERHVEATAAEEQSWLAQQVEIDRQVSESDG